MQGPRQLAHNLLSFEALDFKNDWKKGVLQAARQVAAHVCIGRQRGGCGNRPRKRRQHQRRGTISPVVAMAVACVGGGEKPMEMGEPED